MKTYIHYIIIFLIASVIGCIFTSAAAQTPVDTTLSEKAYFKKSFVFTDKLIEAKEGGGYANFRVLDCDSCMFTIYNIEGRRVFRSKINGDAWVCSVPLPTGIYLVKAGKYVRAFTMLGLNITNRKNESQCR